MLQSIFLFSFSRRELLRIGKAFYNYSQKTLASIDLMGYNKVDCANCGQMGVDGHKKPCNACLADAAWHFRSRPTGGFYPVVRLAA